MWSLCHYGSGRRNDNVLWIETHFHCTKRDLHCSKSSIYSNEIEIETENECHGARLITISIITIIITIIIVLPTQHRIVQRKKTATTTACGSRICNMELGDVYRRMCTAADMPSMRTSTMEPKNIIYTTTKDWNCTIVSHICSTERTHRCLSPRTHSHTHTQTSIGTPKQTANSIARGTAIRYRRHSERFEKNGTQCQTDSKFSLALWCL